MTDLPLEFHSRLVHTTCVPLAGCRDQSWPFPQEISPKEWVTECYSSSQHPQIPPHASQEGLQRAREGRGSSGRSIINSFQQQCCTSTIRWESINDLTLPWHGRHTAHPSNSVTEPSLTSEADSGKNNSRVFLLLQRLVLSLFPYHPTLTALTSVAVGFSTCS